jgi:teichoic acid transport system permease protein
VKALVEIIKDHKAYIQQIFKLAKADLVKTYRGAALGWAWAIIKPAVTIFVYWFTFEIGLRAGKDVNRLSILFVVNCRCSSLVLYE